MSLCASTGAAAQPVVPTAVGTTWEYSLTEHPPRQPQQSLVVQIVGTEKVGRRELLKFETREGDAVTKTELIAVDDKGLHCYERRKPDGSAMSFDPPQLVVPWPLKPGSKWSTDSNVGSTPAQQQQFTANAEEVVTVPAGTYQGIRLRAEHPWPVSVATDRWFAAGVGVVKDVTTTRGPNGRLLSRVTTMLAKLSRTPVPAPTPEPTPEPAAQEEPEAAETSAEPSPHAAESSESESAPATPSQTPLAASPESTPATPETPARPPILLEVAADRDGEPRTQFTSDAPNIFVRWNGTALPINAAIRVAWVAEDVGDVAPPNFIVDETETIVARPDTAARFTLSRPRDGWAAGKYRVDLYLDDSLAQSVSVTITD